MTARKPTNGTTASFASAFKQGPDQVQVSFLDIIQSDLLLAEFDRILNIKRGKMLSALKIEQIYEKIHLIESIVDQCTNSGQVLTLEQLQEYSLNLGALQMVNFLPHMDLIPI